MSLVSYAQLNDKLAPAGEAIFNRAKASPSGRAAALTSAAGSELAAGASRRGGTAGGRSRLPVVGAVGCVIAGATAADTAEPNRGAWVVRAECSYGEPSAGTVGLYPNCRRDGLLSVPLIGPLGLGSGAVKLLSVIVGLVPVRNPFGDVPGHVEDAIRTRSVRIGIDRYRARRRGARMT